MINGKTSLVGVLGCPVTHSLSPIIHNAALSALNLNWCYLAIPCKSTDFELVVKALGKMNCKGLNITIPHKQSAIKLCKRVHPIAKNIGAVNTLIPSKGGDWIGTNTDINGFLSPLNNCRDLDSKSAIIIGSGGSARAVIHALISLNLSQITIIYRKIGSFKNLLDDINLSNTSSTKIQGLIQEDFSLDKHIANADLIVNATPVGMNKNQSEVPLGSDIWASLQPNTILYDLIYTPRPTKWLQLGDKYSCIQIDGLEMLIQQGAESLRLWSGIKEMPTELMKKAAEKALDI